MKARDIIPGWPRGRSTTTAEYNNPHRCMMRAIFLPKEARRELLLYLNANRVYHEQQQQMVDAERKMRAWRAGDYWPLGPFECFIQELYAHWFEWPGI